MQGDGEGAVGGQDDGEERGLLGKEGAGYGGARGHDGAGGLADDCCGGE